MVFSTYTMTFVLIPRKGKSKRSAEVAMQSLFETGETQLPRAFVNLQDMRVWIMVPTNSRNQRMLRDLKGGWVDSV